MGTLLVLYSELGSMLRPHILLALLAPCLIGAQLDKWMPRSLGSFKLAHAGFVEVFDREAGGKDMYITTFNPALPFFHDGVYFIGNPGNILDDVSNWASSLVQLGGSSTAFWPNYPVQLPSSVLGFEGVVQTSGFLVPGKKTGKLEVYDTSSGTPVGPIMIKDTAADSHDWSYHWIVWKDVDGDGLIDIFTARFRVPTFGDPISELIWLKNPGTAPPSSGTWAWQHYTQISGGPDVYFEEEIIEVCNPDCAEFSVIVTGELWTERIMLYYVPNEVGAWANPANIQSIVVDDAPGQPFEARFADLNNDGVLEILASAYDTVEKVGNFWCYHQLADGSYERTALASGFIANSYLFGNSMTPGKSRTFWPSEEYKNTLTEAGATPKPWIALSGDDDGVHYVMFPLSEDPTNFEYEMQVMVDTEATTAGTMAVADLDGDGYTEIISAGYTSGEVFVYTFAP